MEIKNALFQAYRLECTHPGCTGRQKIEQPTSAGLMLGEIVPVDTSDPSYGRCPRCLRNIMRVVTVPEQPKPLPPKGFTKVPTE